MISKRRLAMVAVAALSLTAACAGGDERTEKVVAGMSRDSALSMLRAPAGTTAGTAESVGADSLKNVWRRTQYLMNGVNIEVIWYSPSGEKWTAADTVPKERVIPVVLLDGKVAGVGRSAYNKVAEAYKLPPNRY